MNSQLSNTRTNGRTIPVSRPVSDWLPWLLFVLICAFAALDFGFWALSWSAPVPDTWGFPGDAAMLALAFGGVGQLLARRRPQNPIGWLFLVAGLSGSIYRLGIEYHGYVWLARPGALPGGDAAAWTASWLWFVLIGIVLYTFLLFPTGSLPSERWRPVAWGMAGTFALMTLVYMVRPGPLYFAPYLDNPIAIAGTERTLNVLALIASAGLALSIILVSASVVLRLRHARGIERQQLKWFAYVSTLVCAIGLIDSWVGMIIGSPNNSGPKAFQFLTLAAIGAIPLTVGFAILRHRLWDIDLLISRTLAYGALSAGVALTYFLIVGLLGTLLNTNVNLAAIILTMALAGFLFRPLSARLQRSVNRTRTGVETVAGPNDDREEPRTASEIPLRRRWLALAHVAWVCSAAIALLFFLAAIPLGYALLFSGQYADLAIDAPAGYVSALAFANGVASMLAALVSLGLAALLFWKRRHEPMALFVSFYLLAYGIIMAGPLEALNGFRHAASSAGGLLLSTQLVWQIQGALITPPVLFLYLFPNGRFVPGWTRWATVLLLLIALPLTFADWSGGNVSASPLSILSSVIFIGLFGAGFYAQIHRYRRVATPVERQQIKWVVSGVALTFLVMGLLYIPYGTVVNQPAGGTLPAWVPISELGWWASLSIIPLCLAVAVMRYRLWDIDILLNRALVYGSLTAVVVGMYVLVIAALGALVNAAGNLLVSLLATAVIAVLFQPLRERVQRGVNRLMYGERDDPYAVISRLGQRLEASLAPDAVLPMIVETVAQALKLPYAAIQLTEGGEQSSGNRPAPMVASYGQPQTEVIALPLIYQSAAIGRLLLAPRAPGEAFTPADRQLLANIAQQAGLAAHTVRLTADLQHSRERLITAREEERRRLRRDLHDGLGPALAAQTLKVGSARALYPRDPAAADALLAELERDSEAAIADIRRLVYNLRPPALDELGLVGAICELAAQYRGSAASIHVDAPTLPALSAAVEVAAYRIVQEALANVIRHAHARTCKVQLAMDDALHVTVTDDGQGIPPNHPLGIGLTSMRERAAELGGSCSVEAAPHGGTRVCARLPLGVGS